MGSPPRPVRDGHTRVCRARTLAQCRRSGPAAGPPADPSVGGGCRSHKARCPRPSCGALALGLLSIFAFGVRLRTRRAPEDQAFRPRLEPPGAASQRPVRSARRAGVSAPPSGCVRPDT